MGLCFKKGFQVREWASTLEPRVPLLNLVKGQDTGEGLRPLPYFSEDQKHR